MATKFKLRPGFSWLVEANGDLDTRSSKLAAPAEIELLSGTGTNQADKAFADTRTLAASANEDLDLAGALLDPFGITLNFVKIKGIYVRAAPGNTNSVIVKPAAANGFTGPFGGTTPSLTLPPGGYLVLAAPVGGWTVTAGTGDKINFANSAGSTSVTYDAVFIGTSA